MASRKNWSEIRDRRLSKPAAKAGYERARRAFALAAQLRELRESRGLSQAELARRIGSTQPAVARLEAGGVAPTIDTLERIGDALDLELAVSLSARSRTVRKGFVAVRAKGSAPRSGGRSAVER
jgi:HTH-type transcriptional regulator/antitoxin HipB